MAANRTDLEALHSTLTEFWAERLKSAKDGTGEPLTAAEATAVAKFLKDNNVTALISATETGQSILASLPFEVEADDARH